MAKDKYKKLSEREYDRAADYLRRQLVPDLYPCMKCGYPVQRGYCCTACGDTNPSSEKKS
jgi:rubrerythrin